MDQKRILVVGGVAGGATFATRMRRLDEDAEIIIFEKGEFISFANCGLPYYIGDVIKDREDLLATTKEALWKNYRIVVKNNTRVSQVNPQRKTITVVSEDGSETRESYDELVLAPGAKPVKPDIEGIDSDLIFTLRNVPDSQKIKDKVEGGAKEAVVIGGGFIGLEVAENLVAQNLKVHLVQSGPQLLTPLDLEMARIIEDEVRQKGVEVILNDRVIQVQECESGVEVITKSGRALAGDMVILAIGVTPDTDFLKDSGISLGEKGHILVDEKMKTNLDHIWAVGDAVLTCHRVNKAPVAMALAGPAHRQARLIAANLTGARESYGGSQGSLIIKVFDLVAAATGLNEKQLEKENKKYYSFFAHPKNHASYFPGSEPMTIKIITDESGKVLGAQGVGKEGVDKFIDTLSAIIHCEGTVTDLAQMDQAYAPPYSTTNSPANIIGALAKDHFDGLVEEVRYQEVMKSFNPTDDILLDVRSRKESEQGRLTGAMLLPLSELRDHLDSLDKSKTYWVYDQKGSVGFIACRILKQKGFVCKNISGGYAIASLIEEKDRGDSLKK